MKKEFEVNPGEESQPPRKRNLPGRRVIHPDTSWSVVIGEFKVHPRGKKGNVSRDGTSKRIRSQARDLQGA